MIGNDEVLKYLLEKEGFLEEPTNIGDGVYTIGSGLTDKKWHNLYRRRGNVWSEEDNRRAVLEEIQKRRVWAALNIPNWSMLPEASLDALLSYKYNYDFNSTNSPNMYLALKQKDWNRVAKEMNATSKIPKFLEGLQNRREEEQNWFLSGFNKKYLAPVEYKPKFVNRNPYNPFPSPYVKGMPVIDYASNTHGGTRADGGYLYNGPLVEAANDEFGDYGISVIEKYLNGIPLTKRELEIVEPIYDALLRRLLAPDYMRNIKGLYQEKVVLPNIPAIGMSGDEAIRLYLESYPLPEINVTNEHSKGGKLNTPLEWEELTMKDRALHIRDAVSRGLYDISDIKKDYNEFKKGGPKKTNTSAKLVFLNSLEKSLKGNSRYNTENWRKYFTELAAVESSYNPNITNNIGAKGYFQLMPFNRASSWNSDVLQFYELYRMLDANMNYFKKNLTKEDLVRANLLGIDIYGLMAGAHLGGAKGALNALRGKNNAKDANGTSVLSYMTRFSLTTPRNVNIEGQMKSLSPYTTVPKEQPVDIYKGIQLLEPMPDIQVPVDLNTVLKENETITGLPIPEVVVTPLKQKVIIPTDTYSDIRELAPALTSTVTPYVIPSVSEKINAMSNDRNTLLQRDLEDSILRNLLLGTYDENKLKKDIEDLRFYLSMSGGNTLATGGDTDTTTSFVRKGTGTPVYLEQDTGYFVDPNTGEKGTLELPEVTVYNDYNHNINGQLRKALPSVFDVTDVSNLAEALGYDPATIKTMADLKKTPQEKGLEIVSPEFAALTLGRAGLNGGLNFLKPGSTFWQNPITQQIAAGELSGRGVDVLTSTMTPYSSFAKGVATETGMPEILAEALNPGYYISPTATTKAIENSVRGTEEAMTLFNSPLTGNWTKIGNREYRLSPNSLGVNGSPLESRKIGDYSTGIDLNKMRSILEDYDKGLTQYKGSKSPSSLEFNYEMPKIDFDNLIKDDFVDYLSQQTGRKIKRVPIKDTKHGELYKQGFSFVDDEGKELAYIAGRKESGDNVWVGASYVSPEFRHRGLGKQMYFDFNDHVFNTYGTTLHSSPYQRVGSTGQGMSPSNRLWKSLREKGMSSLEGEGLNRYDVMAEPSKITTAYRTPAASQITAENAASITPELDAAYKAAVESGNRPEALRLLEQAYLRSGIPLTDITVTPEGNAVGWYHGSEYGNHTIFDSSAMNATIGGASAHGKVKGNFLTTDVPSAMRYAGSSRFSSADVPEYTSPQTFSEKVKKLFGVYKPRRLYPAERVGNLAPKPERLFDTKGRAPIDYLDKTDNVVYPMYVNPGDDIMRLDFQGKPWSRSPVEFSNNFYLKRWIRDDAAKTYRDEIVPYKDYETAYKAWTEDPINIRHGSTSLDGMSFDDNGIRSIEGFNSAPRYETVRLVEERVPNTSNGAVQTAAKEGKTSVLMRNIIDSNGGPEGTHYAIDDFVTLRPEQMKLADITYDDAGNLIPLSKRFNWSNPDIRYGLIPFGTSLGALDTIYKTNKKALGGNLFSGEEDHNQQMNMFATGGYPDEINLLRIGISPKITRDDTLRRSNHVFSNYASAKDNPLSVHLEKLYNTLRFLKDNIWLEIPSGVSNCTLTASLWINPLNPIKNASSIVDNPELYGYSAINGLDAIPGDLLITKVPGKPSYHTMLISGYADKDGQYTFNNKKYSYKKGEPLLTYSSGGHDDTNIRRDVPLSVYSSNSDGYTENLFYRYNYPNEVFLPEVVVTKANGGNLYNKTLK